MNNVDKLKLSKDIYNTCMVLKNYCEHNLENEKISDISTIIKFLSQQADNLYYELSK